MIIDCHGHYTTAPEPLTAWRKQQTEALQAPTLAPGLAIWSGSTSCFSTWEARAPL